MIQLLEQLKLGLDSLHLRLPDEQLFDCHQGAVGGVEALVDQPIGSFADHLHQLILVHLP